MKKKVLLVAFIILIVLFTILKHVFVCDMPIVANITLGVDDALMVNIARYILMGEWIGDYNDVRLSKGLTFPIMLAFSSSINLDYITMMTSLYTIACFLFMLVISKRIKNKIVLAFLYVITLFNPVMYSYQVMQRIYRNAIIPSLSILIMTGYLYLFFTRNDKKVIRKLLVSILTGIVLAAFWYTREDSIWMLPFIGFMCLSMLISCIYTNRKSIKNFLKSFIVLIVVLLIPFGILFGYRHILASKNEEKFGRYTIYNDEAYKKAMKSLKKVKKYDYYENIDFTVEKLKRVSEVSCLKVIYQSLEGLIYGYAQFDSSPETEEVANGWFPWALKGALNQYGYYGSAEITDEYFNKLHTEIEIALAEGKLEYEDVKPDILHKLKQLAKSTILTFKCVLNYEDIYFMDAPSKDYEEADKHKYMMFYDLTHNKFMVQDKETGEDVNLTNNEEGYNQKVIEQGKNVKTLVTIYKYLNIPTFIVASIAYVIYSFVTLIQLFKKKLVNLEMWVVISSVLGAMFSIMMGIAYETAFNAYVITAMYLSVAYPLMLLFSMLMISVSILKIIEWIKNRKENKKELNKNEVLENA